MTNNNSTVWALYDGDPYHNVSHPFTGEQSCDGFLMGIYDCPSKAQSAARAHGLGIGRDYYVISVAMNKYEV